MPASSPDSICSEPVWALAMASMSVRLASRSSVGAAAGAGELTRRRMEQRFAVSSRTAKLELNGLMEARMIEFDRSEPPGRYVLQE